MFDVKQMLYDAAAEGFHDEIIRASEWLVKKPKLALYCTEPETFVQTLIKYNEYYENYEICSGLTGTLNYVKEEIKIAEITSRIRKNLNLSDIYRQDEHE